MRISHHGGRGGGDIDKSREIDSFEDSQDAASCLKILGLQFNARENCSEYSIENPMYTELFVIKKIIHWDQSTKLLKKIHCRLRPKT